MYVYIYICIYTYIKPKKFYSIGSWFSINFHLHVAKIVINGELHFCAFVGHYLSNKQNLRQTLQNGFSAVADVIS